VNIKIDFERYKKEVLGYVMAKRVDNLIQSNGQIPYEMFEKWNENILENIGQIIDRYYPQEQSTESFELNKMWGNHVQFQ
jgi:hypothetical protein